jgi:hypothetical protein
MAAVLTGVISDIASFLSEVFRMSTPLRKSLVDDSVFHRVGNRDGINLAAA